MICSIDFNTLERIQSKKEHLCLIWFVYQAFHRFNKKWTEFFSHLIFLHIEEHSIKNCFSFITWYMSFVFQLNFASFYSSSNFNYFSQISIAWICKERKKKQNIVKYYFSLIRVFYFLFLLWNERKLDSPEYNWASNKFS